MDLFRVRLNCIDHYQSISTRFDPQLRRSDARNNADAAKGPRVPVVRVFGATETGQKVCAHIHGAFPYMYIEYEGSLVPEEAGAYIYRLHMSIDHALAVSYRHKDVPSARLVARITLAKGVPFYGFHVGYRFFLKIYMYSPTVMSRLADLLQQGVIMKRHFQPYEAHLGYILQFMTDFNLYGCGYIEATNVWFRAPVPTVDYDDGNDGSLSSTAKNKWNEATIPRKNIVDDSDLRRTSHCSIEVDICVQDIANRRTVKERRLHHDFIERLKPLRPDLKLVPSLAGLWKDEARRRARKLLQDGAEGPNPAKPGSSGPFPPDALVSMSADPRNPQLQEWMHEREFRQQMMAMVEREKDTANESSTLAFDTFMSRDPLEDAVQTVFQSVEDLFPANIRAALGLDNNDTVKKLDADPSSSIEVDEDRTRGMRYDDNDDKGFFSDEDKDEESAGGAGATLGQDPLSRELEQQARGKAKSPSLTSPDDQSNAHVDDDALSDGPDSRTVKKDSVPSKRPSPGLTVTPRPHKRTTTEPGASPSTPAEASRADDASGRGTPPGNQITQPDGASTEEGNCIPCSTVNDGRNETKTTGARTAGAPIWPSSTPPEKQPHPPGNLTQVVSSTVAVPKHSHRTSFGRTYTFATPPPSMTEVCSSFQVLGIPDAVYQDAYYGDERDIPPRPREYAGKEFRLEGNTVPFLADFDPSGAPARARDRQAVGGGGENGVENGNNVQDGLNDAVDNCSYRGWEFEHPPPSYEEVDRWARREQERETEKRHSLLTENDNKQKEKQQQKSNANGIQAARKRSAKIPATPSKHHYLSQVDGPTPRNKHAFRYSQRRPDKAAERHEVQDMSIMSVEVHVNTRSRLLPDPAEDEIQCIFWALKTGEGGSNNGAGGGAGLINGIVVLSPPPDGGGEQEEVRESGNHDVDVGIRQQAPNSIVVAEESELDVLVRMVEIVRTHDPDILAGYEVHGGSWGYLVERARARFDYDLCDDLARTKRDSHGRFGRENDRWGFNTTSSVRIAGRHMINVWRSMRAELNLLQYTLENVAWHLLHRRVPHYSWPTLTRWYRSGLPRDLHRLVRHFSTRARLDIAILDANELVPRTSEQARLLGVDFFSVFSRGSQFKVESIMFRIAKPESLMLVSPSRAQVGRQNALECLPLVMEPMSGFYTSPVVVLDFQSLYPSVMIAYNYCYSTFLGRTTAWRSGSSSSSSTGDGKDKMGFAEYHRDRGLLGLLASQDAVTIAPNGIMYAKASVRRSLLAKMLTEILETRVMVKTGMKQDKDDKALQQLLNNRQLALKLLANVTYGYASASFSGRMPCAEIADSIVQTGRETLERAIALIHSVDHWRAEVVYGDTDSLFVHLPGRTREQAFALGAEMARVVTDANPRPVKLKFEKVYHPCVLLAKKRYVGYKFESPGQAAPEFEAKGIETVRRDGTPAEQKIEERALRLLFESSDLSAVKAFFQQQCDKLMRGAVSVADFCFAREPQYGERVPYVVVTGAPGARLADRCVAPEDLLENPHQFSLDADYYISKNLVPPLERIFNLVGANVRAWYDEMPKVQRMRRVAVQQQQPETLETFVWSSACLVCGTHMTRTMDGDQQPDLDLDSNNDDNGNDDDSNDDTSRPTSADDTSSWSHSPLAASICITCASSIPSTVLTLNSRLSREERRYTDLVKLCRSCEGASGSGTDFGSEVLCESMDCPVYYTRKKQASTLRVEREAIEPVLELLAGCGGLESEDMEQLDVITSYGDW